MRSEQEIRERIREDRMRLSVGCDEVSAAYVDDETRTEIEVLRWVLEGTAPPRPVLHFDAQEMDAYEGGFLTGYKLMVRKEDFLREVREISSPLDAIYIAGWLAGGRVREMGVL